MTKENYSISVLEPYIVGGYKVDDCFSFSIYLGIAPLKGDKIKVGNEIYGVESVVDDTDDDEEGLSYSKVTLILIQ